MGLFDRFRNQESKGQEFYCIVGLGNPGRQYEETKHNVGFKVIDRLAEKYDIKVDKFKNKAFVGDGMIRNKRVLLVKPQTFMNLSGESVVQALEFYKLDAQKLIVLYDDVSLDPGKLRIRRKGSHGGHNGIRSIIDLTGRDDFPRVKIGVGKKPHPDYDLAKWVLGKFPKEDQEKLDQAAENAGECVKLMVQGKTDEAMNKYNS